MTTEATTTDTPGLTAGDVKQRWRAMCANMQDMERGLLRLMAHPEATAEQVMTAKNAYSKMLQDMQRTLMQLQERYPRRGTFTSPAWGFTSLNGHTYEVRKKELK